MLQFNMNKMKSQDVNKINKIILHHSCGRGTVEAVHNMHKKQGWAGIGYHFYITRDGVIHNGRPIQFIGSHCQGNNTGSIGICLEGDFRKEKPTTEQLAALKNTVNKLRKEHPNIKRIFNHRDLYPTECPVYNLKAEVE